HGARRIWNVRHIRFCRSLDKRVAGSHLAAMNGVPNRSSMQSPTMRLLAPAKINLHLRVGPPPTPDGFHPLLSWMCTVALFDMLTLERNDRQPRESQLIELSCDDPGIPRDATNLIVRVGTVLSEAI